MRWTSMKNKYKVCGIAVPRGEELRGAPPPVRSSNVKLQKGPAPVVACPSDNAGAEAVR